MPSLDPLLFQDFDEMMEDGVDSNIEYVKRYVPLSGDYDAYTTQVGQLTKLGGHLSQVLTLYFFRILTK